MFQMNNEGDNLARQARNEKTGKSDAGAGRNASEQSTAGEVVFKTENCETAAPDSNSDCAGGICSLNWKPKPRH